MQLSDDHFSVNHPGPINNSDMISTDPDGLELYGTDTHKSFAKEYADTYLADGTRYDHDYIIFNEELWQFVFDRYGGLPIKRFYIKKRMYT